jgi:hypothetical protein
MLWKLFGKYFFALFPLLFILFCVTRLDGEPCRVKSRSPCAAAYFFTLFGSFVVLWVFLVIFMRICHVHVSSL